MRERGGNKIQLRAVMAAAAALRETRTDARMAAEAVWMTVVNRVRAQLGRAFAVPERLSRNLRDAGFALKLLALMAAQTVRTVRLREKKEYYVLR